MAKRTWLLVSLLLVSGVVTMAAYNRPYRWWPVNDMTEQPIIKPFNQNGLRAPVEGTVSMDAWDFVPKREELANYPDFKNPVAATPESIATGAKLYETYCWACHGTEMMPDASKASPVFKKGMPAANIRLVKLRSDEYIFATLTHGGGIMRRVSYHLSPEERWHVVNYVRSLADKH